MLEFVLILAILPFALYGAVLLVMAALGITGGVLGLIASLFKSKDNY